MMIGVTFFVFVATGLVLALVAVGVLVVLPTLVRRDTQNDEARRRIQSEIVGKEHAHFTLDRAKASKAKRRRVEAHTMPLGVQKLVKTGTSLDKGVMG